MKPAAIISTYPDVKSAQKIAKLVVNQKLAACVNIIPITSIYTWKNKTENQKEQLAIFKTMATKKADLKKMIKENHPYEVPEIAEIKVDSINIPYLRWLVESTS